VQQAARKAGEEQRLPGGEGFPRRAAYGRRLPSGITSDKLIVWRFQQVGRYPFRFYGLFGNYSGEKHSRSYNHSEKSVLRGEGGHEMKAWWQRFAPGGYFLAANGD